MLWICGGHETEHEFLLCAIIGKSARPRTRNGTRTGVGTVHLAWVYSAGVLLDSIIRREGSEQILHLSIHFIFSFPPTWQQRQPPGPWLSPASTCWVWGLGGEVDWYETDERNERRSCSHGKSGRAGKKQHHRDFSKFFFGRCSEAWEGKAALGGGMGNGYHVAMAITNDDKDNEQCKLGRKQDTTTAASASSGSEITTAAVIIISTTALPLHFVLLFFFGIQHIFLPRHSEGELRRERGRVGGPRFFARRERPSDGARRSNCETESAVMRASSLPGCYFFHLFFYYFSIAKRHFSHSCFTYSFLFTTITAARSLSLLKGHTLWASDCPFPLHHQPPLPRYSLLLRTPSTCLLPATDTYTLSLLSPGTSMPARL